MLCRPRDGKLKAHELELLPDLHQVAEVLPPERRNDPLASPLLDPPLALKDLQRVAERRPADVKNIREAPFVDHSSRADLPADDQLLQQPVYLITV